MNDKGAHHEKNIPTEQYPPQTHSRIPGPHEDQKRSRRASPQTGQRPQTTGRLIFRSRHRIKTRPEFLACYSEGKKYHSRYFLLFCRLHDFTDEPFQIRLGLAMGRKTGNAAQRNRWKRLVREYFRQNRDSFPPGCDVVVVAKRGVDPLRLGFADVESDLHAILRRLRRDFGQHSSTKAENDRPGKG